MNEAAAAPLLDRLFSFVIDYLVISPFVLFALYVLYHNGFQYWRSHPQAPENDLFFLIASVSYVIFFSAIQSFFISVWQATPGQFFLKIRLQFHESQRFLFFRAFARQAGFWFGFPLLGIPFLSVMTNPRRRTFYDRLGDASVVTRKEEHPVFAFEKEYIYWQSFTVTLSLFAAFLFSSWVWKNYEKIVQRAGSFAVLEERSYFCEALKGVAVEERLATALGLNLASQLSDDCLNREADFVFWKFKKGDYSLAYYAKSLTAESAEKEKQYRAQACRGQNTAEFPSLNLGCRIAHAFPPDETADLREELYTSLQDENFLTAALRYELGKQLQKDHDLAANFAAVIRYNDLRAVKKYQISEMLTRLQAAPAARSPASHEEDDAAHSTEAAGARILQLLEEL